MLTEQEDTRDRLAVEHGRVCVREGYADGHVEIVYPPCTAVVVNEAGRITKRTIDTSIDWRS